MSKSVKILVATTMLTIGTTVATHALQNETSIQRNTNVENVKLLEGTNTRQSNLLSNSIVYTCSVSGEGNNGLKGLLIGGQISFDKNNMKIKTVAMGGQSLLDGNFINDNTKQFAKFTLFNANLQAKYNLQTYTSQKCTVINELNDTPFNYGDIIAVNIQDNGNSYIISGMINNKELTSKPNSDIPLTSTFKNGETVYIKVTSKGLVVMNGLYTAPNGNTYYFKQGQMLKNTWVNVNAQGEKTNDSANGSTINAYYLGNDGIALKGLQKITGIWQYLNPETSQMELNKFITVDGKVYYAKPINGQLATGLNVINGKIYYFDSNGIMQTGIQEINNKIYYFNPENGEASIGWKDINGSKYYFNSNGQATTGFQKIDNKVYHFANDGKLISAVSILLNGVNNITINVGEKFNPLEGVTLNDPADSTAKISVSGHVNISIPGVYQLTYTATDKYGQKITVTREITVKSTSTLSSNTQALYWSQGNLVINGNLKGENTIFDKSTIKKLVIINQDGQIVSTINTIPINWYSKDQNNYSGFQGIISPNILSELKENTNYKFYIEVNGNYIPLTSNLNNPYNENYLLSVTSSNQLNISKNTSSMQIVKEGMGIYKVGYFINNGYVINGNILLNNDIFSKGNTKILVLKNSNGQVIDKINTAAMNWYSLNSKNYSGFQAIIPNSTLNKLKVGENYNLSLEVIKDNKIHEMPINNTEGFILNKGINYNISTNSQNNITITKTKQYPIVNSGISSLESGYWKSYGYVMNIKFNIEKDIPKGTKVELISKNSDNQVVSVTPGVNVNWYSSNKNNYNGFQAMITPKQLVEASTSNKLYVRVTIDGKTYESPLTGNVDTFGSGNLNYGFKTINNQVHLIIK